MIATVVAVADLVVVEQVALGNSEGKMMTNEKVKTIVHENSLTNTSPLYQIAPSKPSWQRWWRQMTFMPFLHSRWLTEENRQTLANAVAQAETGHRGEIFFVIENTLPLSIARTHDSRDRAIAVFSNYRVWDTAENTGVLVYLNLCEHRLEIVADRGINAHVLPTVWQAICDKAITGIKAGKQIDSLVALLDDVGQLLRQFYQDDKYGNELKNTIVYLK